MPGENSDLESLNRAGGCRLDPERRREAASGKQPERSPRRSYYGASRRFRTGCRSCRIGQSSAHGEVVHGNLEWPADRVCRSVPDPDRLNVSLILAGARRSGLHLYQLRHVLAT